jgi:hypothetical protein
MYVVFDKNKKFISYSDKIFSDFYYYREIPSDKTDFSKWKWEGDYENGEMISIKDIFQTENVNKKFIFQKKYPVDVFLSLILKQLLIVSKKNNNAIWEFEEMAKEYIIAYNDIDEYFEILKSTIK